LSCNDLGGGPRKCLVFNYLRGWSGSPRPVASTLSPDRIAPAAFAHREGIEPCHVGLPFDALRVSAVEGVVAGVVVVDGVVGDVMGIFYVFHI